MKWGATGALLDQFPYARVGCGPRTMVVLPGVDDAMFSGRYPSGAAWTLYWYFSRFVDDHTVYVVSRPRGLPEGYAIADMADEYAAALADELGPADVVGFSMGGQIAQELCIRHPELVENLVLANTGHRIDDLAAVDRFLQYAREHDWASIRAELAVAMFADWRAVSYPPIVRTAGRILLPSPAVPTDVQVSLDAVRAFDAADRLAAIDSPTLVFGGTDDPYFPEAILRRTAAGIPDAELATIRGGKHAAFHERKATFDSRVASFLADR